MKTYQELSQAITRYFDEGGPYKILVVTKRGVALSHFETLCAPLNGVDFVLFEDVVDTQV